MTKINYVLGTMLLALVFTFPAQGQQRLLRFQNAMQSVADVTITPRGGTPLPSFAIGAENVVDFPFVGEFFDIQVVPRDERESGFRFLNVNLRDLADRAQGQVISLDGIFMQGPMKQICVLRCVRRIFRCRCYCECCWVPTRGERVAVIISADLIDGRRFSLRSPKMSYDEVFAPRPRETKLQRNSVAEFREWTDDTGTFRVRARLIRTLGEHVRLLKENGKFSTVSMLRLSEADRQFVAATL